MPGSRAFTYFQLGKESVAGTAVAATRMLYPDGTGLWSLDRMRTRHPSANRGTRSNQTHVTQQGVRLDMPFATASDVGVAWDELIYPFSQLKGGVTGVGGTADKTWTFTPNQTSANSPESYTIEYGDDTQNYEADYCQSEGWTLSFGVNDLTQLAMPWFGRQSTKSTKTAVAANNGIKIPSNLWTIKFAASQAGLTAASVQSNFLLGGSLAVDTGLRRRWYNNGVSAGYFGQTVEAMPIGGTLDLTVESTALAVTEFYDKSAADTIDFIRLKAIGPVLGSTFYSAQIDLAVSYDDPVIIASQDDGVNIYTVHAELMYDSTFANAITAVVVGSLAAIP